MKWLNETVDERDDKTILVNETHPRDRRCAAAPLTVSVSRVVYASLSRLVYLSVALNLLVQS